MYNPSLRPTNFSLSESNKQWTAIRDAIQQTTTKASRGVPVEVYTVEGTVHIKAGTHLRATPRRDFAPLQCLYLCFCLSFAE